MTTRASNRYDTVAMYLHWLIAILMIPMLFFGEELMEVEDGDTGAFLPTIHVTVGVTILILSVLRLVWRVINPPPALPATMALWELSAAKLTHFLFYVLLIGLPLTGWLAFPHFAREEGAIGFAVFGVWQLPNAPDMDLPFGDLHEIGNNVGIGLLILHVLAALKHHFINRDDILRRMLPL